MEKDNSFSSADTVAFYSICITSRKLTCPKEHREIQDVETTAVVGSWGQKQNGKRKGVQVTVYIGGVDLLPCSLHRCLTSPTPNPYAGTCLEIQNLRKCNMHTQNWEPSEVKRIKVRWGFKMGNKWHLHKKKLNLNPPITMLTKKRIKGAGEPVCT